MILQYLGTAAAEGAPALFCMCEHCQYARRVKGHEVRTRAGAMLDGVIKLDFGPDSYMQELLYDLDYASLQTLLITHAHEDHFDLSEVLNRRQVCAHLPDGTPPMTVYGNGRVGDMLQGRMGDMLIFQQVRPFEPFTAQGYTITPLEGVHNVIGRGDGAFNVLHKGQKVIRAEEALIYLIEKDGKALLYAHDTDELSDANYAYLAGKRLDLVSLDCTNGYLDVTYIGHMGVKNNLAVRQRLMEIGAADENTTFVANHFSHNGLKPIEDMQAMLPGFLVAWDGMTVEV